jgi:hypothetical protein
VKKSDEMKKLAVLLLALLIVPCALAEVVKESRTVAMQSTLITQGYQYAIIIGMNRLDRPISVQQWNMKAILGPSYAFCELQPTILPPGAFAIDVATQCQTRSGFTTMYTKGTMVSIETYVPQDVPANSFSIDTIAIETKPTLMTTPFPLTAVTGTYVMEAQPSGAGSFMFFAGIGAIIILAITVILVSMLHEE